METADVDILREARSRLTLAADARVLKGLPVAARTPKLKVPRNM